jgi:hypothetical protein
LHEDTARGLSVLFSPSVGSIVRAPRWQEEPVMPVTAKLSKLFYERLGDEVANELVDWFNRVDDSYRADLRELNELNFARFEAKLGLMASKADLAEIRADLTAHIHSTKSGFAGAKSDLTAQIQAVRSDVAESRLSTKADISELREFLERRLGEQTRWMFAAWSALLIPMIGILLSTLRR